MAEVECVENTQGRVWRAYERELFKRTGPANYLAFLGGDFREALKASF